LPKNAAGRLNHQAVRYVLHRFFLQRHEWTIKGLEPAFDTWHASSDPGALAQAGWVPALLQDRLEKHLGTHGLDLVELAALAAVLEDIIHKEGESRLKEIYEVLEISKTVPIADEDVEKVLTSYAMVLLKKNVTLSDPKQAAARRDLFERRFNGWDHMRDWMFGLKQRHFDAHPPSADGVNFASMARLAERVGDDFGAFQNIECSDMKRHLIDMGKPSRKPARIRLADFYNGTRHSLWRFTEKVDYLRSEGALDESNASQPLVIVPNYILSHPNCLEATGVVNLHSVCCHNECEDLMGTLEREVAAPTATPEQIIEVVTTLSSDTVIAPRELSEALSDRLREVARTHGGKVHLHSRLFSQWMHHAYPYECPYPHEAGAIKPQTADDWVKSTGQGSASASAEDMKRIVDDACPVSEHDHVELPWTHADAVLGAQVSQPSGGRLWVVVFMITSCGAMIALVSLNGSLKWRSEQQKMICILLVACWLSSGAFAFGMLDGVAFAFEMVAMLALLAAKNFLPEMQQDKGKLDKDFV